MNINQWIMFDLIILKCFDGKLLQTSFSKNTRFLQIFEEAALSRFNAPLNLLVHADTLVPKTSKPIRDLRRFCVESNNQAKTNKNK